MSRTILRSVSVSSLILAAVSFTATAAEGPDRTYETIWMIQADENQIGTRRVAVGSPIIEQRLLPFGLAETVEDIRSGSGDVLVEKGRQLFQLRVATGKTFCVVEVPRPSFYRSFMLGGGNLQLCLIDSDDDGVFDGHFNGGNPMRGVPFINGRQPRKPKQAMGRYSLLTPDQFSQPYTVRLSLVSADVSAKGDSRISYRIDFGDEVTRQKLTNFISGGIGHTEILDAQWNALEIGDDVVKVDVTRPMPSQPFQAVRITTYR